ncbi:MAG: SDR family NAD(P)-dependent oxidoreductase, partial [Anaerolineae bacterium]|nr:SDR family NAD(P)-dependent oxidoreductase [Anaerolineae bacterium]
MKNSAFPCQELAYMDEFTGKVVLVTGAGRGLGRKAAIAFSAVGGYVAANDINPLSLDETVNQVIQNGGIARPYVFDIAKRMPIEGMIAQVLDHFGRIDILINHAAVAPDASILEMDEWEFHRTLDVNLGGPFFTMQQVGRVMRQQGGGVIVNLISTGWKGEADQGRSACSASQAGLIGLTQAAAAELSRWNIRANIVGNGPAIPGLAAQQTWDVAAYRRWLSGMPEISQMPITGSLSLVIYL